MLLATATHSPLKNSVKNPCVYFFQGKRENDIWLKMEVMVGVFLLSFLLLIRAENSHPLLLESTFRSGPWSNLSFVLPQGDLEFGCSRLSLLSSSRPRLVD